MTTKKEQIEQILKNLKENNSIEYDNNAYTNEESINNYKYNKVYFWEDISPFFSKLNNIKSFFCSYSSTPAYNIFSKLAKFNNLTDFSYIAEQISDKNLEEGLLKLPKLNSLYFSGLTYFPKSILALKNLSSLSLTWNRFYKQNFHFKLKIQDGIKTEGENTVYNKILTKIKSQIAYLTDTWVHLPSVHNEWNKKEQPNILILLNRATGFELSISVFVLNEMNRYETFKTYYDIFKKINKTEKCFETINETEKLSVFFNYNEELFGGSSIYLEKIKQDYLNGNIEYIETVEVVEDTTLKSYQVNDLLKYIGGDELIRELSAEKQKIENEKTKSFQNNLYVESIELKNFKQFKKTETIPLSKTNILVGKNSTGKTSLLQAIAFGLIPENTPQIERNYTKFINNKLINTEIKELHISKVRLKWKQEKPAVPNNRYQIDYAVREQNIYPETLSADKKIPATYLVLGYGENLFPDSKSSYDTSNRFVEHLTGGDYINYNIESLFSDYYRDLINPLYLLDKLQENELPKGLSEKKVNELTTIKEILLEVLNTHFLDIKEANLFKIETINNRHYFIDKVGNDFDLYALSEGYRTNISLVTDILVKIMAARNNLFLQNYEYTDYNKIFATVKGTILIDEFDKHLHPVWQKSFVGALRKVLKNVQFVLSTHNVVALQSAEGQKALKMTANSKGEIIIEEKEIQKGDSIETLLNKFFDFDNQFFGNKTEELFDKFYKLLNKIANNTISAKEKKEFKNITNDLLESSEEVSTTIKRELIQYKNQTGKTLL